MPQTAHFLRNQLCNEGHSIPFQLISISFRKALSYNEKLRFFSPFLRMFKFCFKSFWSIIQIWGKISKFILSSHRQNEMWTRIEVEGLRGGVRKVATCSGVQNIPSEASAVANDGNLFVTPTFHIRMEISSFAFVASCTPCHFLSVDYSHWLLEGFHHNRSGISPKEKRIWWIAQSHPKLSEGRRCECIRTLKMVFSHSNTFQYSWINSDFSDLVKLGFIGGRKGQFPSNEEKRASWSSKNAPPNVKMEKTFNQELPLKFLKKKQWWLTEQAETDIGKKKWSHGEQRHWLESITLPKWIFSWKINEFVH
jgi:hypothetical protein